MRRFFRLDAAPLMVVVLLLVAWPTCALQTGPVLRGPTLRHASRIAQEAPTLAPQIATFCDDEAEWGPELSQLHAELADQTAQYLSPEDDDAAARLEVAYLAHLGQRRRSGDSFITHPCAGASILAESR